MSLTANRTRLLTQAGMAVLALFMADRVSAQSFSTAGVSMIGEQVCAKVATKDAAAHPMPGDLVQKNGIWRKVGTDRLAFFVSAYARETMTPDEALAAIKGLEGGGNSTDSRPLADTLYDFQQKLASGNVEGIKAFGADGTPITSAAVDPESSWITRSDVTIRCLLPDVADGNANPRSHVSLRLRGNVDALTATGKARKSADAATFGYTRTRTYQEDGSRTQDDEIKVDAVLGAVLDRSPRYSLSGYVAYQLKRTRSKPAPVLTPPATERDGDTDIVTLGIMGETTTSLGGADNRDRVSLRSTLSANYLFDRVKDSERVKGELTFTPFARGPRSSSRGHRPLLGLCDLGGLTDLGSDIWTSCELQGVVTYNQVTKHGSLLPTGDDHFGHAGGKAAATLYLGNPSEDTSFFLSADFEYLARYDGNPADIPNIKRHEFKVGHRWWQGNRFALEINATLVDGINPDSFADENALTLGFGVIF